MLEEKFTEMVHSFGEGAIKYLNSLENALQAQAQDDFKFAVHSLKGLSGNVGAIHVHELAKQMEKQSESDLAIITELELQTLKIAIEDTKRMFDKYQKSA